MSESKVDDLGVGLLDADPLVAARLAFGHPATAITLPATLLRQRLSSPSFDLQLPRDSIEAWGAPPPPRAISSRRSPTRSHAAPPNSARSEPRTAAMSSTPKTVPA